MFAPLPAQFSMQFFTTCTDKKGIQSRPLGSLLSPLATSPSRLPRWEDKQKTIQLLVSRRLLNTRQSRWPSPRPCLEKEMLLGNLNMRHEARQCVSRAKKLLSRGEEAAVRYACLELRFAIEYITYSQLQAYMKEVSDDALKKWTPKQVISEMLEVDPCADKSRSLAVGLEKTYGVPPPPGEVQSLGEDRRFSMNWANKSYNALGNFLHAPTMHQMESGGGPSVSTMTEKATLVADECEKILNSSVFNVNLGTFLEFDCIDCGTHVRRRIGSVTQDQGIVCPNSKCQAVYDFEIGEHGRVKFHLRQSNYTCQACGTINWLGIHRLATGTVLECANDNCRQRATIVQRFELLIEDG